MGIFADPRWLAYYPMVRRGLKLVSSSRIDWIIATSPPEVTFMVARTLSRRTGIPWIADFRDLWFRDMMLYRSRLAASLSGPLNRWLVKSAALLVTVSRGLEQRLAAYMRREAAVSYNGFFDERPGITTTMNDGRKHIVYTGRLYPGKRDPQPLFRALSALAKRAPDVARSICVNFYGFDDPWLRGLVQRHGVEQYVALHGFVPYATSMAVQRAADALLFLDWTDTAAEGVLTGKLFEYLGSRRPILALGPRADSEAAQIIADTGAGRTLTTDAEIVEYLSQLANSPRLADVPEAAAERFSRERQAVDLLDTIQRRLGA